MYSKGDGVAKDGVEAVKWYRKAAKEATPTRKLNLGAALAEGDGVPKDGAEGIKWLLKAAYQGKTSAQGELGKIYFVGTYSVPKDDIEALAWWDIGAASGDKTLEKFRDGVARSLSPDAVLQAQQRSKEIFHQIEASKTVQDESASPQTALPASRVAPK